jgi:hypothetical protein
VRGTLLRMYAPWVAPFLEQLTDTGNVSASARSVGVSSTSVYALRKTDADFAAAWDQALEDAADTLEAEARRRAVQGVQEPVVYQGQLTPVWERDANGDLVMEDYETIAPPGLKDDEGNPVLKITNQRPVQARDEHGRPMWLTVTKYSDALLALLLKGRRKKVFADRTELTGADGAPVAIDESTRVARVAQLLAIAEKRAAGDDFTDLA